MKRTLMFLVTAGVLALVAGCDEVVIDFGLGGWSPFGYDRYRTPTYYEEVWYVEPCCESEFYYEEVWVEDWFGWW